MRIFLLRVLTRLSYWIELQTIEPTELKMRQVEMRQLRVNSLTSVQASFERAQVPYESMKKRQHWYQSLQKGLDHIQIPLVHYLVLLETLKPCPDRFKSLFKSDDLPILYLPTRVTNPTGRSHSAMISKALGSTSTCFVVSLNLMSWMGKPQSLFYYSQQFLALECYIQEKLAQESQNCYLKLLGFCMWLQGD